MARMMSEKERKMRKIVATVGESAKSALGDKIALENERKAKLERVKMGLMNDLLTGRKRVKN